MNITGYINKRGIQRKLIVSFLLLGLIPMIIMGSVSYYKSTDIMLKNTNSEMINLTKKSIELLDSQFTVYRMQMDTIVGPAKQVTDMLQYGMALDAGNTENLEKTFAEQIKSYPAIKRISVFDGNGDMKVTSSKGASDQSEKASSLPWFKQASAAKDIIFGEVFVPKGMSEPVTTMVKTFLTPEGKPFAYLAVDISAEYAAKPITTGPADADVRRGARRGGGGEHGGFRFIRKRVYSLGCGQETGTAATCGTQKEDPGKA